MKTYIVVTDNCESYIKDVLNSLLPLMDDEELIIFDNHSTDETVPIIVGVMRDLWLDASQRYKFYINTKKETIESTIKKAKSIANGKPIVIDKKKKFDISEVLKDVENK